MGIQLKLAKKAPGKTKPKVNVFGEEKKTNNVQSIDGYSKKGAHSGEKVLNPKKKPLVIAPMELVTELKTSANLQTDLKADYPGGSSEKRDSRFSNDRKDDAARESLISGTSHSDLVLQEGNETQDYENVPVEEFGAAMLRGMGWKPEKNAVVKPKVDNRQKGMVLGIGAKSVEAELIKELNKSYEAPLKRKTKEKV